MDFKKLSKINDSLNKRARRIKDEEKKLYGATLQEWDDAGAMDAGGLGFDVYEFSPEGLAEMAVDMFNDSLSGFDKPESTKAWEKKNNIDVLVKEWQKSHPDAEYTNYGGVIVFFENEDDDSADYEILKVSDEIEDVKKGMNLKKIAQKRVKDDEEKKALVKHYTNGANVSFVNDFETCAFTVLYGKRYVWLVDMPTMDICETVLESKGGEFENEEYLTWNEIKNDSNLGGTPEASDTEFSEFIYSMTRFEREANRRK